MLVFGVDIPLMELVFSFAIILFLILIEAIIIISLLVKQLNKTKQLVSAMSKSSDSNVSSQQKRI